MKSCKKIFVNICKYLQDKCCNDCGETDIRTLEFDHNDCTKKRASVYELMSRKVTWESILEEIYKCTVRCSNCHKKRTNNQFGFYRQRFFDKNLQKQAMGCCSGS